MKIPVELEFSAQKIFGFSCFRNEIPESAQELEILDMLKISSILT